MKSINSYADDVARELKTSGCFSDFIITRAFPNTEKQTPLTSSLITVGIDSFEITNSSIDSDIKCGDLSIFVDIYVPIKLGVKVISRAVNNVYYSIQGFGMEPCSIKAGRTQYDNSTQAYKTEIIITFNNEFKLGGEY